mmetsp:Transcript_55806/g.118877  ORF Transcript_55806/g.118877 Transcript_55806/m.118877 type:complete len:481 (+) Transcript_55806:99-1541(+)
MAAAVHVPVRKALTGELVTTLSLTSTDSVETLLTLASAAVDSTKPLQFIFEERELVPGPQTLAEVGLGDGSEIQALVSTKPPQMVKLRTACPSNEGYHCHDTTISNVSSNDPNAFWMTWQRGYYPPEDKSKYCKEYVLTDLTKSDGELVVIPGPSAYRQRVLAMHGQLPLVAEPVHLCLEESDDETDYWERSPSTKSIELKLPDGSARTLWSLQDSQTFVEEVAGNNGRHLLLFTQGHFAQDGAFFCLAEAQQRDEDDDLYVLEASVEYSKPSGAGSEVVELPRSINFKRWVRLPKTLIDMIFGCGFYSRLDFLYSDESAVVMRSSDSVFLIDRSTFEFRLLIQFESKDRRRDTIAFDSQTYAIFLFVDESERWLKAHMSDLGNSEVEEADGSDGSCEVFRFLPQTAGKAEEEWKRPELLSAQYSLDSKARVCEACLTLDGFSDAFCMLGAQYIPSTDTALVLDAESGLWSLPCKAARWC